MLSDVIEHAVDWHSLHILLRHQQLRAVQEWTRKKDVMLPVNCGESTSEACIYRGGLYLQGRLVLTGEACIYR